MKIGYSVKDMSFYHRTGLKILTYFQSMYSLQKMARLYFKKCLCFCTKINQKIFISNKNQKTHFCDQFLMQFRSNFSSVRAFVKRIKFLFDATFFVLYTLLFLELEELLSLSLRRQLLDYEAMNDQICTKQLTLEKENIEYYLGIFTRRSITFFKRLLFMYQLFLIVLL